MAFWDNTIIKLLKKPKMNTSEALFVAISKGRAKQVAKIAETDKDVISKVFGGDRMKYMSFCDDTPLSYAIRHERFDIVEILLKAGARITGRAILHVIPTYKESFDGKPFWPTEEQRARAKEVLALLLRYGADINMKAEEEGYCSSMASRTALHLAAGQGDADLVQWLLDAGADPTIQDCYGWTPLEFARQVNQNHPQITFLLK